MPQPHYRRYGLIACLVGLLGACATAPAPSAAPAPASASAPSSPPAPPNAPARIAAAPDPKVLGLWKIEQARAAPLLHKLNARLAFGSDGKLSGNGGCNNVSSVYTLEANKLELGPLVTSRKACGDALMEQEDRVLTALERARVARVPAHGLLELLDADGTVLLRGSRLEAQPQ